MHAKILTFALLPLLALSAPTSISLATRAGAPIPVPLPSTCIITHPYPTNLPCPSDSFQPSPVFSAANLLYQYILEPSSVTGSEDAFQDRCMETCYGYGNSGECVATFVAANATALEYGYPVTGYICQLFQAPFSRDDFVKPAVEGTFVAAKPENQACPPRAPSQK